MTIASSSPPYAHIEALHQWHIKALATLADAALANREIVLDTEEQRQEIAYLRDLLAIATHVRISTQEQLPC